MKSKEQIFKYLSYRDYTDSDWHDIADYIKQNVGSGLHRARHPKINSDKQIFFDWLNSGSLAEGDVLIGNDFIGVFHELPDKIAEGVFAVVGWYDKEGILHKDEKIFSYKDSSKWQVVDTAMAESYYQRLREDGLCFSVSLGTIGKRSLPVPGSIFKYSRNGVIGMAIIDKYMDKAAHLAISITDTVELDLWVPSAQLEILTSGKKNITAFNQHLEELGYSWDSVAKKLITHIRRAKPNDTYWYINDRFGIANGKECGNKADTERYKNRNYFLDYKEALRFRDMIYKLRADN